MSGHGTWPLGGDDHSVTKHPDFKHGAKMHGMTPAEVDKRHLRHDRLIVGGKAHLKKRGLS